MNTKFLFSVMLFCAQIVSNISYAQDNNASTKKTEILHPTTISGFYIGQTLDEVVVQCEEKLGYTLVANRENNDFMSISCFPREKIGTAKFNVATRSKPVGVILLSVLDHVVGVHIIYFSQNVYKKALVDFVNANVVKTNITNTEFGDVQMYVHPLENWQGYFTDSIKQVMANDKTIDKKMYFIHMEYIFQPRD